MKLEKMTDFFEKRLEGYDEHMLKNIAGAQEFYPFTAAQLPVGAGAKVLDLGCGTGIELGYYFDMNPSAEVTGIDLTKGMLKKLEEKYRGKALKTVCGSYFETELGRDEFDAAVSVESLHHFTKEEKTALYKKVYRALKEKGYLILTDYFALSAEEARMRRQELENLMRQQGEAGAELYHYDTPLTVEHEMEALREAGFAVVRVLGKWGATAVIRAEKG